MYEAVPISEVPPPDVEKTDPVELLQFMRDCDIGLGTDGNETFWWDDNNEVAYTDNQIIALFTESKTQKPRSTGNFRFIVRRGASRI